MAGDMRLHVAHLDRAGMSAQQHAVGRPGRLVLQIEGVVHRTRGVVLGRVQCGEILEVGFDLGAVGDFETDRTEQAFDALERARHRMQTAARPDRDQAASHRAPLRPAWLPAASLNRLATRVECGLYGILGAIDRRTSTLRSSGGSFAIPLSNSVIRPLLPR
jgi:hypothetical protein